MTSHEQEFTRGKAWLQRALELQDSHSPFPWQLKLLRRFLKGEAVDAIDIPTGLGKTAVMAIWLVARALGALVPRRLVYVVDRRAVVDQATDVATTLRAWVANDAAVRTALGLGERWLPISTLRGQHADNREWLEDPSAPAIIVGTVDMIGSRLLFSGYGVSTKMRPYHAGLLGVDSMIVLDEAHLVPAFERLLDGVAGGCKPGGPFAPSEELTRSIPTLRFMSLSATGRGRLGALALSEDDYQHPIVKKRLQAKKHLELRDAVPSKQLAEALADAAWHVAAERSCRCIVFSHSREVAQTVAGLLEHRRDVSVELFVGARRVFERSEVAAWLAEHGFTETVAGVRRTPRRPTFLVATSAAEVGVDMDADHMVSDLVPWERMVQRLGRVNRRGEVDASVIVIPEKQEPKKKSEGGADGDEAGEDSGPDDETERRNRTHDLLRKLPATGSGYDASPGALAALREGNADAVAAASTALPLHPPLQRATVESWSMTSFEDHTGRPRVEHWIRGWIRGEEPQTTVVFRRELPLDHTGNLLPDRVVKAYFEAAPPHLAEKLETETRRVVHFLAGRAKRINRGSPPAVDDTSGESQLTGQCILGLLVREGEVTATLTASGLDKTGVLDRLKYDLPGATLLLDVRVGGLRDGLLDREHDTASDVGDSDPSRVLQFRIRNTSKQTGDIAPEVPSEYREETRLCTHLVDGEEVAWLVIESLVDGLPESEDARSRSPKREQRLDEHEEWTEKAARDLASTLGLDPELGQVLQLAARLHDEGKRAWTWQRAFGVSRAEFDRGEVFGKTRRRFSRQLLNDYRHELGSLSYAERDPRVVALGRQHRDICLHLIAAHHGHARPILRTNGAEGPPSALRARAQEVALRFTRLERALGPWGLAWWEALLRAADARASRSNDDGGHDA
jgi:CRISPR-associated endonuclease/helicase Cas3